MRVVAYVPDLMDRSRFPAVAQTVFVRQISELADEAAGSDVVVADLSRDGALDALRAVDASVRRIGFTNHENSELLLQANADGIDAMPRSRFFARIAQLVAADQHS